MDPNKLKGSSCIVMSGTICLIPRGVYVHVLQCAIRMQNNKFELIVLLLIPFLQAACLSKLSELLQKDTYP